MPDAPSTTHTPTAVHKQFNSVRVKYAFPNGYGASVVQHLYSYGSGQGLWELGVLGPDGNLTYDTPVTNDVLGYLSDDDVQVALDQIAALPAVSA